MFVLLLGSGLGLVFLSSVIMLSYIVIFNPCRLILVGWTQVLNHAQSIFGIGFRIQTCTPIRDVIHLTLIVGMINYLCV